MWLHYNKGIVLKKVGVYDIKLFIIFIIQLSPSNTHPHDKSRINSTYNGPGNPSADPSTTIVLYSACNLSTLHVTVLLYCVSHETCVYNKLNLLLNVSNNSTTKVLTFHRNIFMSHDTCLGNILNLHF